jgi:hypothetical protein
MSWYGINALDRAVSRTRKALFEPFNFWKWIKLSIIILLLGGTGSNYGGSGSNYQTNSEGLRNNFPDIGSGYLPHNISIENIYYSGTSFAQYGLLIAAIAGLVLLVLFFYYISNVMEFVFVESLVRNEVKFWAYSRKFLGKGFYLLLIRLALVLSFLVLFLIAMLPFVPSILERSSNLAWPALLGGVFWIIGVIFVLILIGIVINSFLSLAIPLSIYRNSGILSAFRLIFANFRKSWEEVVVYWLIRFLLGIFIAILSVILLVGVLLFLGVIFLVIDGMLYFLFSSVTSDPMNWILLIPFILIELLLLFGTLIFLNVPFAVFMKYHLLSFLGAWFTDSYIPFFDAPAPEPETGLSEPNLNV